VPWTPKQRALFHEIEENPNAAERHGMSQAEGGKLAREADRLKKEGREKHAGFVDLTPVFGKPSAP